MRATVKRVVNASVFGLWQLSGIMFVLGYFCMRPVSEWSGDDGFSLPGWLTLLVGTLICILGGVASLALLLLPVFSLDLGRVTAISCAFGAAAAGYGCGGQLAAYGRNVPYAVGVIFLLKTWLAFRESADDNARRPFQWAISFFMSCEFFLGGVIAGCGITPPAGVLVCMAALMWSEGGVVNKGDAIVECQACGNQHPSGTPTHCSVCGDAWAPPGPAIAPPDAHTEAASGSADPPPAPRT